MKLISKIESDTSEYQAEVGRAVPLLLDVKDDEMIKKVEQKEIILTPTEKLLERKATEKDWEEVDKETNK